MDPTTIGSRSDFAEGSRRAGFLCALLVVAGASWVFCFCERPTPLQSEFQDRSPEPTVLRAPELARRTGGHIAAQRVVLPQETEEPFPRELRVLVQGHVYHRGRALAGWELSFHAVGRESHSESDWDITDDDGHFEVLLAAASYTVHSSDAGDWACDLLVPPGEPELTVDFDLTAVTVEPTDW